MSSEIPDLHAAHREYFSQGKTRDIDFRIASLRRMEAEIMKRESDLLAALDADLGKPGLEAYVAEVFFVLSEIRLFCRKLKRWAKPKRAGNPFYFFPARSEIRQEPFGCSLIISPWNYPVQLALSPLIAAVAAGNCVILKPSELAPATSQLLFEIIRESFDKNHVSVVLGGKEESQSLLSQDFDFIFYTGSERVGKIVAEAAAKNLTPMVLELGGKCPCVIGPNVDIEMTASRIVAGKFFNAGQTCIAPDFVIAPVEIQEELTEKICAKVTEFYSNDPRGDLANIVSDDHFQRVSELTEDSETVIRIGEDNRETRRLAPRILPGATWNSPAMKDEIFGPVLPILGYASQSELLEELKKLPSPLALYLFSRDSAFLDQVADAIQSGSIGINDVMRQATNLNLPFGGVGSSGMGRYRGRFGFDTFTYARAVTKRYFLKDVFAVHPPYDGLLEKLRKFLK